MWPVPDLRAYLSGVWQVDRSLLDRRHAISGELRGQANFSRVGSALIYQERGKLSFGQHEGPAEQSYSYEFPDGNGHALVRFRDGRAFHDLDLLRGQAIVSHSCDPDQYDGYFIALDEWHWQSSWTVIGPRKDQQIITHYTRLI